jgi:signal peptidase I
MDPGFEVEPPDRVAVNKLLAPRRWDIIAFRWPQDPSYEYTKRVVGLPGEEVVIKEGGIWINGTRAEPPAQIASLRFTPGPDGLPEGISGSEKHPARLGMDEYFVVGDFALASSDSRVWRQGAPGHPPFAVPRGYIEGVVGLIYWPPARWRLFR